MTVDACTRSCKEIGQPLAALNYGTVSRLPTKVNYNLISAVFMRTQVERRRPALVTIMWSAMQR